LVNSQGNPTYIATTLSKENKWQSRETGNSGHTRRRQTKHNTC